LLFPAVEFFELINCLSIECDIVHGSPCRIDGIV
jgi:hypothetical protein